jgi:hypothetical protein
MIAGSVDTPVKGIATTMMATLDVCRRANAAGKNQSMETGCLLVSDLINTSFIRS